MRLDTPARFTDAEVVVSARLSLTGFRDEGLFHTLSDARLLPSRRS